ncbi:MAG: DUF6263 family protein [Pirellulaceae bacterium]|nr:DUF6263 family protein [Pirellulaceae bacterium]
MTLKSVRNACVLAIALLTLAAPAKSQDKESAVDDGPIVKLLEQGIAPRQTLRLAPTKGMQQTAIMTMKIDQTIVMRGQKLPATPTPAIQFTIDVKITDVASNGDVSLEYNYPKVEIIDDADQPSPVKAMMETMLKSMEGLAGTATISNRGFTKKSEITLPDDAQPQLKAMIGSMQESMSRLSSPLPEEPIGVGGKWSVTQLIESNGMKMKQTSVHTLKEIKGKTFDVAIELTQAADAQEIQTPGVPPGTSTKLISLESTGEGSMQFESGVMFPISTVKSDSTMKMEMVTAGQTLPMQIEMTMEMSVKPAEAAK